MLERRKYKRQDPGVNKESILPERILTRKRVLACSKKKQNFREAFIKKAATDIDDDGSWLLEVPITDIDISEACRTMRRSHLHSVSNSRG